MGLTHSKEEGWLLEVEFSADRKISYSTLYLDPIVLLEDAARDIAAGARLEKDHA